MTFTATIKTTKYVRSIQVIHPRGCLPTALAQPGDRGCVSCGTRYIADSYISGSADVVLVVDVRGRYWCMSCVADALANVRRRNDERTDYIYPWRFEDTGGADGQVFAGVALGVINACPKCKRTSGGNWRQCNGACPIPESPHHRSPVPEFNYIRLPNNQAKVTCTCGWEEAPMPVSPFDPQEAFVAASVEHVRCWPDK